MTVGGVPDVKTNHCEVICHVALGMIWEARAVLDPITNKPLQACNFMCQIEIYNAHLFRCEQAFIQAQLSPALSVQKCLVIVCSATPSTLLHEWKATHHLVESTAVRQHMSSSLFWIQYHGFKTFPEKRWSNVCQDRSTIIIGTCLAALSALEDSPSCRVGR